MLRDFRYALRTFMKSPLFVLSLALGIGSNTAVFTLIVREVLFLLVIGVGIALPEIWLFNRWREHWCMGFTLPILLRSFWRLWLLGPWPSSAGYILAARAPASIDSLRCPMNSGS